MRQTVVVIGIMLLVGCNKKAAAPGESAGTAAPPAAASKPANSVEAVMSFYPRGFNSLIRPMKYILEGYEREFPQGPKFPPARRPTLNAVMERDLDEATKAFAEGKEHTPPSHADVVALGDKMLTTAKAVYKDQKDLGAYYTAENWKDDKGEAGKKLHTQMEADMKAYREAARAMSSRLGQLENEMMTAELKKYTPGSYSYEFRAFTLSAKRFMDASDDPAALGAALDAVKAANEGLQKLVTAKGDKLHPTFKGFMTQVDNFVPEAIAFARDAKEPDAPKKLQQRGQLIVGKYNNLIQLGNSLEELDSKGYLK